MMLYAPHRYYILVQYCTEPEPKDYLEEQPLVKVSPLIRMVKSNQVEHRTN